MTRVVLRLRRIVDRKVVSHRCNEMYDDSDEVAALDADSAFIINFEQLSPDLYGAKSCSVRDSVPTCRFVC